MGILGKEEKIPEAFGRHKIKKNKPEKYLIDT